MFAIVAVLFWFSVPTLAVASTVPVYLISTALYDTPSQPMLASEQVRVRVLNVDSEARKLVLSMRQKPRPPVGGQGDVSKYVAMLEEVRYEHTHTHINCCTILLLPCPINTKRREWEVQRTQLVNERLDFCLFLQPPACPALQDLGKEESCDGERGTAVNERLDSSCLSYLVGC